MGTSNANDRGKVADSKNSNSAKEFFQKKLLQKTKISNTGVKLDDMLAKVKESDSQVEIESSEINSVLNH